MSDPQEPTDPLLQQKYEDAEREALSDNLKENEPVYEVLGPNEEIHEVARQLTPEEAYLFSIFGVIPEVPPMLAYTKKPIRIWAWPLREFNGPLIANWINQNGGKAEWFPKEAPWQNEEGTEGHDGEPQRLVIDRPDGLLYCFEGDFIIKGPEGDFYKNTGESFQQNYDLVNGLPPANPS